MVKEITVTEEMIRGGKKTSLGGVVCSQENDKEVLLHAAIRMEKKDFLEGGDGVKNLYRLDDVFSGLSVHMRESVFFFKGTSYANDYGAFTFVMSKDWQCLDEASEEQQQQMALEIFVKLLKFIRNYRKCDINNELYRPLLFLCRESVYFRRDKSNGKLQIALLPLPCDPQTAYAGIPHEFHTNEADASSDICMAAYLYLLLKFGDDRPFGEGKITQIDRLAERCLSPFILRRPSIEELLAVAASGESEPVAQEEKEDDDIELVVGEEVAFVPKEASQKKPKTSFLDTVKKKFSQNAKAKGNVSKAKDRFDDMFSTEAADAREENS